jgi:hypothetical protein
MAADYLSAVQIGQFQVDKLSNDPFRIVLTMSIDIIREYQREI